MLYSSIHRFSSVFLFFFFFQAEDGIRDYKVTGVQTCALPISPLAARSRAERWVVSIRSTIRRADAVISSSATRAPADGATVRTASAQPTTAKAVGTAVRATRITKIRWRKGRGIFDGAI